jgi:hypothetical protein
MLSVPFSIFLRFRSSHFFCTSSFHARLSMAKRPSGPPLGCYVFIVGLSGVAYALPYFLTVFFYGFPVFLVFLLLSSRWSKPPTLEEIDEAQVSSAMFDLQTKRHALVEKISAIRKSGRKQGTRYLIDKERFEARSRSGQELNQALTSATSLLSYQPSEVLTRGWGSLGLGALIHCA